jgi:hypothetical protein
MSATQDTLHVVAAVVIYQEKGVIEALKYLTENGYSTEEACSLLELVDNMREAVKGDKLS